MPSLNKRFWKWRFWKSKQDTLIIKIWKAEWNGAKEVRDCVISKRKALVNDDGENGMKWRFRSERHYRCERTYTPTHAGMCIDAFTYFLFHWLVEIEVSCIFLFTFLIPVLSISSGSLSHVSLWRSEFSITLQFGWILIPGHNILCNVLVTFCWHVIPCLFRMI
jgi:hypothetical protein